MQKKHLSYVVCYKYTLSPKKGGWGLIVTSPSAETPVLSVAYLLPGLHPLSADPWPLPHSLTVWAPHFLPQASYLLESMEDTGVTESRQEVLKSIRETLLRAQDFLFYPWISWSALSVILKH